MKVFIVSHKFVDLPHDEIYAPLFVGAEQNARNEREANWLYDDSCDGSLSGKNKYYCELTGQYWMWKAVREDIVGLVHYRRLFASPDDQRRRLNETEIRGLLENYDCIIANRYSCSRAVGYSAPTVAEQYRASHCSTDLVQLYFVIRKLHPFYVDAFKEVFLRSSSFSPFNMIICKKKLLDDYSRWLFSILRELEDRIDFDRYRSAYQKRALGFMAERLLNVFILKRGLNPYYCDVFDPNESDALLGSSATASAPELLAVGETPNGPFLHNGLDYGKIYRPDFYLRHYEDLNHLYRTNPDGAFDHFVSFGLNEGRVAHPGFSISSYMNGNPDLTEKLGNDPIACAEHYIRTGYSHHCIGFENLDSKLGVESAEGGAVMSRHEERTARKRERYLAKAEAYGVLD